MTSVRLTASVDDLTAVEAVQAVSSGATTVSQIALSSLERAREVDGDIRAFRSIDEAAVERRGKELDTTVGGALRGAVVGVKDVIDTRDAPTGYGSPLFAEHVPSEDAEVVRRLRNAGALVLGKTESTEFAMFEPTRTRNPADLARTPGGSSSGSAAAVAAGIVPLALGTQTAGSVVRPGAYCGVYGFKPSFAWTPTTGVWRLAETLDTIGLFARSVADLSVLYFALRSPTVARSSRPRPDAHTAAVLRAREWGEADDDVQSALDVVAARLEGAGWHVTELEMPRSWRPLPEAQSTVMAVEVARNLHTALGDRVGEISEKARAIVEEGDKTAAADHAAALAAQEDARATADSLVTSIDVVLVPSALGVAPVGLEFTGDPVMCRPWTLLGLPSCNVPAVSRDDGLPVGVQAVSPAFDDVSFLQDLALIEAATMNRER